MYINIRIVTTTRTVNACRYTEYDEYVHFSKKLISAYVYICRQAYIYTYVNVYICIHIYLYIYKYSCYN